MTCYSSFIQKYQQRVFVLIAAGLTVFHLGCTVPYNYSYPGRSTFTAENTNRLYTGMSADEVRAIFGSPDKAHDATFGKSVGEPWTGRVWLYFTKRDRKFKHVKRYKKNLFVIYPPGNQMKLNHWIVEK